MQCNLILLYHICVPSISHLVGLLPGGWNHNWMLKIVKVSSNLVQIQGFNSEVLLGLCQQTPDLQKLRTASYYASIINTSRVYRFEQNYDP